MKKLTTLLLCATLCVAINSYGQDTPAPKIGVKGGLNFSNLRVDEIADNNIKVGFNLGLFAKLPVSDAFSVQPEVLYSSKGAKMIYDNFLLGEGEYRFNLNYIEVPVLAVLNIGENFNIHAGPYIAFLTSSNVKDVEDDGTIDKITDLDVDNFNRFDYGLAAGIGLEFGGFMVGARYNYGLNEIGESGSLTGELLDNSKNSVASLFIAYGF